MANITLKARVDTKELDAAIAKVHELVHLLEKANSLKNELASGKINLAVNIQG